MQVLIDRQRIVVFDRYLTGLTDEQTAAVCAQAVPRAPMLTTGQLHALLRRLVIEVDPDAAARWYRRGVRERTVHAYLACDGTVTISATGLPPDEAEAACRRVEALADRVKRAGHPGRVGQIRSDVFLGLLDGRFHGLTDDEMVARLLASPRRTEDTADLVRAGTGDGGAEDGPFVPEPDVDPSGTDVGTGGAQPTGAADQSTSVSRFDAAERSGTAEHADTAEQVSRLNWTTHPRRTSSPRQDRVRSQPTRPAPVLRVTDRAGPASVDPERRRIVVGGSRSGLR